MSLTKTQRAPKLITSTKLWPNRVQTDNQTRMYYAFYEPQIRPHAPIGKDFVATMNEALP